MILKYYEFLLARIRIRQINLTLVFLLIFLILINGCAMKKQETKIYKKIRPALSAGQFYPSDAKRLSFKINQYLDNVPELKNKNKLKAIMVPHAGYDFSGQIAAYGYKHLQGTKIKTAVIICNSHTAYFDGVAIDENEAWETPLGLVEVDHELARKLINSSEDIRYDSGPYETSDQTLEVQIPFLQFALDGDSLSEELQQASFKIVPILFGNKDEEAYKNLIKGLINNLGDDDILIISTDMSHYPSYGDANEIDNKTLDIIASHDISELNKYNKDIINKNIPGEDTLLCGIDGVKTGMELANTLDWEVNILKYANSGDVEIGTKNKVVGYGVVGFFQKLKNKDLEINVQINLSNALNQTQKNELLKIARETVESFVKEGEASSFKIEDKRLNWKEGAFVTLHKNGELRGCIGQIVPSNKPLWEVVRDMAISACSEDTRFMPVSEDELSELDYEISVLSSPELINDWKKIELGKHGVIVRKGNNSGVFLPQVAAETGWSKEKFLSQLCLQKAGLAPDCYKNDNEVEIYVFTAEVFK